MTEMKAFFKYNLGILYMFIAFIYAVLDWGKSYGEDNILFWVFIRPIVSIIKGILWIIVIWF